MKQVVHEPFEEMPYIPLTQIGMRELNNILYVQWPLGGRVVQVATSVRILLNIAIATI
jgi:hypothetical protein